MFFLSKADLDKKFKILRAEFQKLGVSDELRGWNWQEPPVEPPSRSLFFGVGDLAARYCSTLRDVYLKRIENIKPPPSLKMFEGIVYHGVAADAVTRVKSLLFDKGLISGASLIEDLMPGVGNACERLIWETSNTLGRLEEKDLEFVKKNAITFYKYLLVQAASQIDLTLSKFPHIDVDSLVNQAIPPIVERKVDGSLIGLSKELSVDVYTPAYAVADLKTGEVRNFHPYAPTGYALALEADEEIAVNFGMIIYVKLTSRPAPTINTKLFLIGDELRREFLEIRDEAFEIIANARDPGKPPVCPDYCPYYLICVRK
ncbi:MAG: type I-A CRISPR-associated protein Cas4/Csa1 [Crenarchaeota archaeon]|nr:type I-A CRISPR-associated protein Cas4/Csa1 [Thermoproteota archaeon]MDW8034559.1 type I-A CRISPR-associated protein Cas4/Csa1 [Nitrososphaerota archaeon]